MCHNYYPIESLYMNKTKQLISEVREEIKEELEKLKKLFKEEKL